MGLFSKCDRFHEEQIKKTVEGWKTYIEQPLSPEEEEEAKRKREKMMQELRDEIQLWQELGRPIIPNSWVSAKVGNDPEASALHTLHNQLLNGKSTCIHADKCPDSRSPINCLHCRNLTQPTRFEPRED